MATVVSNIYWQLVRRPSAVIEYCVKMLRNQTRHYCDSKVVHLNMYSFLNKCWG